MAQTTTPTSAGGLSIPVIAAIVVGSLVAVIAIGACIFQQLGARKHEKQKLIEKTRELRQAAAQTPPAVKRLQQQTPSAVPYDDAHPTALSQRTTATAASDIPDADFNDIPGALGLIPGPAHQVQQHIPPQPLTIQTIFPSQQHLPQQNQQPQQQTYSPAPYAQLPTPQFPQYILPNPQSQPAALATAARADTAPPIAYYGRQPPISAGQYYTDQDGWRGEALQTPQQVQAQPVGQYTPAPSFQTPSYAPVASPPSPARRGAGQRPGSTNGQPTPQQTYMPYFPPPTQPSPGQYPAKYTPTPVQYAPVQQQQQNMQQMSVQPNSGSPQLIPVQYAPIQQQPLQYATAQQQQQLAPQMLPTTTMPMQSFQSGPQQASWAAQPGQFVVAPQYAPQQSAVQQFVQQIPPQQQQVLPQVSPNIEAPSRTRNTTANPKAQ